MKKNSLTLISVFICSFMFGQAYHSLMDENGTTVRNQKSYEHLATQKDFKDANDWESMGPYGGDVLDMAVYPLDTNIVIAAAGVPYISHDGGASWVYLEALLSMAPNGIQCIEAASNGTLYASGPYSNYKIFRSTDGGESWEQKATPVNAYGLDIKIDPNDPLVVFIGLSSLLGVSTNNVIIKSSDGGDSWIVFDMTSVLPVGWSVVNLVIDPGDSQVIFAIGSEGFSNGVVVASFNGGENWENRNGNLPTGIPYNSLTISEENIFIAGGQLFGGQYMGIYKSENDGLTWSNISSSFPNKVSNAILIDPGNTDKMYVATEGDGIYYTNDGGANWNYNTTGAGNSGAARCLIFEPGNTDVLYAGFLSLAVCKSFDAALSWEFANKGIATLQTDDVEVDPNDPLNLLIGFEGENSGGCYMSTDGAISWQLVEGLPGTRFSQVTFGTDGTMYAWSNGPSSVAQEGLYKSTDGGETWLNTGPNVGTLFETEIFALVASKTDPNLLFIGGNNFGVNGWESVIHRTTNGGEDWELVYMGPENYSISYLFVDPNSFNQKVYAGYGSSADHCGFLQSIDAGSNWADFNAGIPSENKWGGAIVCDPQNSDIMYGGIGGYGNLNGTIYKTINGGEEWTQTPLQLGTYSKIRDIMVSPQDSEVIYVASAQDGVYVSFDAGESWETANNGLAGVNVTGFSNPFILDDSWYFCASTYSYSAFITKVFDPSFTGTQGTINGNDFFTVFPNPSKGEIAIKLSDKNRNIESLSIYTINGKLLRNFDVAYFLNPISDLSLSLEPNMYICKIVLDGRVYSMKLVIVE